MKKLRFILILAVLTSLFSCFDLDLLDPDKIDTENIELKPNMIFPVLTAEVTMKDLLDGNTGEGTNIETLEDGSILMKYIQKDIANFNSSEVLNFPRENEPINSVISIPDEVKILGTVLVPNDGIQLGTANATVLVETGNDDVILSELIADFNILVHMSSQPFSYTLTVHFNNEGVADQVFSIGRNQELNKTISFNRIKFSKEFKNKIRISTSIKIINDGRAVNLSTLSTLNLNYKLNNFVFNKVYGDFGNTQISIPSGVFDVDIEGINELEGSLKFRDPKLSIILTHKDMGAPFNIDLNLISEKTGETPQNINKGLESILLARGSVIEGRQEIESLSYTTENSNIKSFFDLFPMDRVKYNGVITLNNGNPVNIDTKPNFITKDASLKVDLEMEMPMNFTIQNLIYQKIIEDVDLGIDEDEKEKILEAKLHIKATNGWPLSVSIDKISFQDALGVELSSIKTADLIGLSPKDASGAATTIIQKPILIGKDVIQTLDKIKQIVLRIKINTPEGGAELNNRDKLSFVMAIEASLDLSRSSDNQ